MRNIVIISSLFLLLISPGDVAAAVVINEVAWMGSTVSANHEWIELYNNGTSDEDVTGWLLKDGMNLEVALSGVIKAKDYAVLERTSEESASGSAFLIYAGALVNTGATLTLYNSNGDITDRVSGGENWQEIGGDNTTKETAQYTVGGWVTDVATPGSQNKPGRSEEAELPKASSTKTTLAKTTNITKGKSASETVKLVQRDSTLVLTPVVQTVAYVNQKINFTAKSSGLGETILNSLNYTWNFGDSYSKTGKSIDHTYEYPGTYVITLRGNYGRHDQVARQEITILPVNFSLSKNESGDVQINNDAPYDVNISGYYLLGEKPIVFPAHTVILPKGTITIKKNRLGQNNSTADIAFYDEKKTLLASTATLKTPSIIPHQENQLIKASSKGANTVSQIKTQKQSSQDFSVNPTSTEALSNNDVSSTGLKFLDRPPLNDVNILDSSFGNESQPEQTKDWLYVALIGVLFLGFFGIMQIPKKDQ